MSDIEDRNKLVFGETFKKYTIEDQLTVLHPLKARLALNNISTDIFRGKNCLDAGCGGGRGSLLMGMSGAKEITAFDVSECNLENVKNLFKNFDLNDIIKTVEGNLFKLPFDDETFDFVWCNGVIHHTGNTFKALDEICRVLKTGGNMWLYVYGKGGIYWYTIDFIRRWLSDLDPLVVINILEGARFETVKIAEFIDDWYCPVLDRYAFIEMRDALISNKMYIDIYAEKGMIYDTSMRIFLFNENTIERILMGQGDLRFLLTKIENTYKPSSYIPSELEFPNWIFSQINFEEIEGIKADPKERVLAAAMIQRYLRDVMGQPLPFDINAYKKVLNAVKGFLLDER